MISPIRVYQIRNSLLWKVIGMLALNIVLCDLRAFDKLKDYQGFIFVLKDCFRKLLRIFFKN